MYRNWKISRWETPFSDIRDVVMVKLVDVGELWLILEAPRLEGRPRWRVNFGRCPAYRNIMEKFRLELWAHLDDSEQYCGKAFTVPDSPWIAEFKGTEVLLEILTPEVRHFVVVTEDDVVEVLTGATPEIVDLGATDPDEPAAGKSLVFHVPEEGSAAAASLRGIARRIEPPRWWARWLRRS